MSSKYVTDRAGHVALITGSAIRVGRAIALELANAGCDIAVHYHSSKDAAESLAQTIRDAGRKSELVSANLDQQSTWSSVIGQVLDRLGRLDILVNNASIFPGGGVDTLENFDPSLWGKMLRLNLLAPTALCHYAEEPLLESPDGLIVNLCDASVDRPWTGHLGYSVSKAGLVCLTKALARGLAPKIRVNGVAPGIAEFPEDYSEVTRQKLIQQVPLKRAGSAEDMASAVRFLACEGRYITGQIIYIDGGRSIN